MEGESGEQVGGELDMISDVKKHTCVDIEV